MTIRANIAALTAAIDAAVARDASPLQSGDIMSWDPIRQLLLDMADTYYDDATMQGVVLTNGIIVTAMLAASAVESGNIGDDAVVTAKIADDAVTGVKLARNTDMAARLIAILGLPAAGSRLNANAIDGLQIPAAWALNAGASGRAPKAQLPSDTVYDADIASLFDDAGVTESGANIGRIQFINKDGTTANLDLAAMIRNLVEGFLAGGTDIGVSRSANTLTIAYTGTGSGGSTPPPASHTRYFGRSADTTFTATEFTGANGQSETDDTFAALPTWSGNDYLAFAVPDSTGDITGIVLGSSDLNQIGAFQRVSGTLQINSVAYKVWRSNNELNFSGERAILTQAA